MSTRGTHGDIAPVQAVQVKSPCELATTPWKKGETARFCDICRTHVHNLSAMSTQEAARLIRESGEKLCVRYEMDFKAQPVTRDRRWVRAQTIALRAFKGAAAILGLSGLLAWLPACQTGGDFSTGGRILRPPQAEEGKTSPDTHVQDAGVQSQPPREASLHSPRTLRTHLAYDLVRPRHPRGRLQYTAPARGAWPA